jgi:hypothetical protein
VAFFGRTCPTNVSISSGTLAPNSTLAVMASGTGDDSSGHESRRHCSGRDLEPRRAGLEFPRRRADLQSEPGP